MWITTEGSLIRLVGEGVAQFGHPGGATVFTVVASEDTTAVLDVSAE